MPPLSLRPLPRLAPPRELYRVFLRNMRYVPDPHVWTQIVPPYKRLLRQLGRPLPPPPEGPVPASLGVGALEKIREDDAGAGWSGGDTRDTTAKSKDESIGKRWTEYAVARERKYREIQQAKTGLNQLRAAVACHPHAFERLLSQAYAQSGKVRWKLIKRIVLSSPIPSQDWTRKRYEPALEAVSVKLPDLPQPTPRPPAYPPLRLQPLPPVLRPLIAQPTEIAERGRLKPLPLSRLMNRDRDRWLRDWDTCPVPLTIPPNPHGTATGWEDRRLEDTLRLFAGLPEDTGASLADPRSLPSYAFLPPGLARVFPKYIRHGSPPDPYPKPRAAVVQGNSRLWSDPRHLTGRLRRRMYARFVGRIPRVQLAKEAPNPAWCPEADEKLDAKEASAYPEPKTILTWKKRRMTKEEMGTQRASAFARASEDEMRWWRAHLDKNGSGVPDLPGEEGWLVRRKVSRGGRDRGSSATRVVTEETGRATRTTGAAATTSVPDPPAETTRAGERKARDAPAETPEKPKRSGRRKAEPTAGAEAGTPSPEEKPKRGRARKTPVESVSAAESAEETAPVPKRRGRPRKNPVPDK